MSQLDATTLEAESPVDRSGNRRATTRVTQQRLRRNAAAKKSQPKCPTAVELSEMERVGPFHFRPGVLQRRQLERLREIAPFFTPQIVRELLAPVALQTFEVSLRALDYMCTNYAKKTQILTELPDSSGQSGLPIHVYTLYKDWLKHYRRKTFDPFRRRQRIFFLAQEEMVESEREAKVLDTTVAQLNFLRWAVVYGVVSYVRRNAAAIEQDMLATLNESKQRRREDAAQGIKRRRSELSKAPAMKCIVYELPQRLFFEGTATASKL